MMNSFEDRIRALSQRFRRAPRERAFSETEAAGSSGEPSVALAALVEKVLPVTLPITEIVDELFALAVDFGSVTVRWREPSALLFTTDSGLVCEVSVAQAKGLLRCMGSRLAIVVAERSGKEPFLYGGAAAFTCSANGGDHVFYINFENTMIDQWLRIGLTRPA